MPAKTVAPPEPDPAPATTNAPADPAPAPDKPQRTAGAYEFTGPLPTQYLHVPLTAHPADPGRAADGADPGVPERAATVFAWPDGPPADGRWEPTRKKPNQAPDNAGPLTSEE